MSKIILTKTQHLHKCVKCKRVWICNRTGMDMVTKRNCSLQKKTMCDACMARIS